MAFFLFNSFSWCKAPKDVDSDAFVNLLAQLGSSEEEHKADFQKTIREAVDKLREGETGLSVRV
jgi:hypothetical protein